MDYIKIPVRVGRDMIGNVVFGYDKTYALDEQLKSFLSCVDEKHINVRIDGKVDCVISNEDSGFEFDYDGRKYIEGKITVALNG